MQTLPGARSAPETLQHFLPELTQGAGNSRANSVHRVLKQYYKSCPRSQEVQTPWICLLGSPSAPFGAPPVKPCSERVRRVTRSHCITPSQAGAPAGAPISKGQHSSTLSSSWAVGDLGQRVLQAFVSVKQSQPSAEQLHSPACLLLHLNYTKREPSTCEYSRQMLPLSNRRTE